MLVLDDDLQFVPLGIKNSVPQWNIFIGDKKIAYVVERTMAFPSYRVSISDFEDKFFENRKEVIQYLLAIAGCLDLE